MAAAVAAADKTSAWFQDACKLLKRSGQVICIEQNMVGDDKVKGFVRVWDVGSVEDLEGEGLESLPAISRTGLIRNLTVSSGNGLTDIPPNVPYHAV